MSVTLRPYQQTAVNEVRAAFAAKHRAVLLQIPTGGGKTIASGYILGAAADRGNVGFFICNRVELVEQTAASLAKLDVEFGIIAAGFTPNPLAPVQVCSIDTLRQRLDRVVRPPRLIVWDECRSIASKTWSKVFVHWTDAKHLGLDATPVRQDGKGLDGYFSHLVHGPTYSELVAAGALVPFDLYAPATPDLGGVRTVAGDYDQAATALIMDKPTVVGDVVAHYRSLTPGQSGLAFAVSRSASEHLAAAFRAAGVQAVHLDGDSDKAERKRVVAAFRRREIKVLCNVDLFTAGFDVPGVGVIMDVAPTKSLAKFLQKVGRGSRPEPAIGKTRCTLLDHAGNWRIHGMPDADRTWTLEGREAGRRGKAVEPAAAIRQCPDCFYVMAPPQRACPSCGAVQAVAEREVEVVDGDLRKITPELAAAAAAAAESERMRLAQAKKAEVGRARTLADLEKIGQDRGYKPGWARAVWAARGGAGQRPLTRAGAFRG